MDGLSHEIMCLIVHEIWRLTRSDRAQPPVKLASYSTISRDWQYAIEELTMRHLTFGPEQADLTMLSKIFSESRRQSLVRHIRYKIVLPTTLDTDEEVPENEAKLYQSMYALLEELAKWEEDIPASTLGRMSLVLDCGFTDYSAKPTFRRRREYRGTSIAQQDIEKLPLVKRITSLQRVAGGYLDISPKTWCRIAARLPALEVFELPFCDYGNPFRYKRSSQAVLGHVSEALTELQGYAKSLKVLRVQRHGRDEPRNHSFNPQTSGRLSEPDRFCEAIRTFVQSTSLEELHLEDIAISSDLFRDCSNKANTGDQAIIWPCLRRLKIKTKGIDPEGTWYYTGHPDVEEQDWASRAWDIDTDTTASDIGEPPESDSNPQYTWRRELSRETFDPLVEDLADAVLNMPKLESCYFHMERVVEYKSEITIECVSSGQFFEYDDRRFDRPQKSRIWKVHLSSGYTWRPSEKLISKMEAWAGQGNVLQEVYKWKSVDLIPF